MGRVSTKAPGACVYFVRARNACGVFVGPIKIGTSINPHARLAQLQERQNLSDPGLRLEVLAVVDGSYFRERSYHQRYAAHRLPLRQPPHGREWFTPAPELLKEIARLRRLHGSEAQQRQRLHLLVDQIGGARLEKLLEVAELLASQPTSKAAS